MITLPFGEWPSPVAARDLATSSVRLSPGVIDAGVRYWAEGHPEQGGRVGLWRQRPGEAAVELTPDGSVRTGVNEYGGGDWAVRDGIVAWCSWPDGAVMLAVPGRSARRLAPGGRFRYAGLSLYPAAGRVLAVREDHGDPKAEPATTIVARDLATPNADGGEVLVSGADFYAHPTLSADGRLAWCEWSHPDMPWDAAQVVVAPATCPTSRRVVAGGGEVSALYPAWAPDGGLLYLSDASGFWNFQRWDGRATRELHPASHDFCGPLWVLAPVPYTVIDAGRIGCTWLADGSAHLGVLDFEADGPGPGRLTEVRSEAVAAALTGTGPVTLALLGYPTRPAELVELDWDTGDQTTLLRAAPSGLDPAMVARARPVSWESPDGPVHGWYYPPTHSGVVPPEGVSPPVQVWSHGGPTAFSTPGFEIAVQFWTTRGIGILDVNYSGSAGYGRAYRERLRGNWGISDVRDCVAAAQALVAAGLADPDRLSIRGSSAGGFTTLAALTGSDVFAAGISLYGIGDLEALVRDSHKFEAHYLDGLIAPYPAGREIYRERSPLHHLDRLNCPMLILQGRKDTVVPPSQAQALADAVQSRGLAAELIWFDDEGHGFRRAESIIATAEAALAFLGRVHGFDPG